MRHSSVEYHRPSGRRVGENLIAETSASSQTERMIRYNKVSSTMGNLAFAKII